MATGLTSAPRPQPEATDHPVLLSVIVLAWNNLELTRRCVDSVRRNTDTDYELIIVDNGSSPEAARYARDAADYAVLNSSNRGFAIGMNQGLATARGTFTAFCNNDVVLPDRWASQLVQTARSTPRAALVVPAVTAASNPLTVRESPVDRIDVLDPFSAPPPAVVYLLERELMLRLGGWDETYPIASGEDVDLCFTIWVNDLDIAFDQRVLVEHVSHATAIHLSDWQQVWASNRRQFLDKWMGDALPAQLDTCDPERFLRNRATARSAAGWMDQYFRIRDRGRERRENPPTHRSAALIRALRRYLRK
jgi:GT2 family glycosyltransferase